MDGEKNSGTKKGSVMGAFVSIAGANCEFGTRGFASIVA